MTKEEFLKLAAERYDALKDLDRHDNFYDYEKEFEQIMLGLSRAVLQKNLGELPEDRRKKKASRRDSAQ